MMGFRMSKWLLGAVLAVCGAGSFAAPVVTDMAGLRPEAFKLYENTIASLSVNISYEGIATADEENYKRIMKDWVSTALTGNGVKVNPVSAGAPHVRVDGFCGRSVNGCELDIYIDRDVSFDLPDGRRYPVKALNLAHIRLTSQTASYNSGTILPVLTSGVSGLLKVFSINNTSDVAKSGKPIPKPGEGGMPKAPKIVQESLAEGEEIVR